MKVMPKDIASLTRVSISRDFALQSSMKLSPSSIRTRVGGCDDIKSFMGCVYQRKAQICVGGLQIFHYAVVDDEFWVVDDKYVMRKIFAVLFLFFLFLFAHL